MVMELKHLLIVAIIITVWQYGWGVFLYPIVAAVGFTLGFVLFLPECSYKLSEQLVFPLRGLVKIKPSTQRTPCTYKISGSQELDSSLNEVIHLLIRDYISSWYEQVTSDTEFVSNIEYSFARILQCIAHRASAVDWIPFITEDLPTTLTAHLCLYSKTLKVTSPNNSDFLQNFFDTEAKYQKNVCRDNVCTCIEHETAHLRKISEMFLFLTMEKDDYRVPAFRYLLREVLVKSILLPTINLLSDPDFVNLCVCKTLCKNTQLSSEGFIQALRLSDSCEELTALAKLITTFRDKLRGRDAGGNDDAYVKAQLGSLAFIRILCNKKSEAIKRGKFGKHMVVQLEEQKAYNSRSCEMSFDDVIRNDLAMPSFLDFLTSIKQQVIFSLYLNCVAYRVNVESMSSGDSSPDSPEPLTSVCSSELQQDTANSCVDITSKHTAPESAAVNETETPNVAADSEPSTEDGGEMDSPDCDSAGDVCTFGLSLCNVLLKHMPASSEKMLHKALRQLSVHYNKPDSLVFKEVEEELVRTLSSDQYFGAFKQSPYYKQMLYEVGLAAESPEATSYSGSRMGPFLPCNATDDTDQSSPIASKMSRTSSVTSTSTPSPPTSIIRQLMSPASGRLQASAPSAPVTTHADAIGPHADIYTASLVSYAIREDYVEYMLDVTCTSGTTRRRSMWQVARRFRQFDDLHTLVIEQCGRIPQLKLPPKKAFNNFNPAFLDRRRDELSEYVQAMCDVRLHAKHPTLRLILIDFLQQVPWEYKRFSIRGMAALVNPLRNVGNAVLAMPDNILDGFAKMLSRRDSSTSFFGSSSLLGRSENVDILNSLPSNTVAKSGNGPDQFDAENFAIRILFTMVDVIFDLQQKAQPVRRGILSILARLLKTFFGVRVHRMIIDKASELISAEYLTMYVNLLRDSFWCKLLPDGTRAAPVNWPQRDDSTKQLTRMLCRNFMLDSVAADLAQYLGSATTYAGILRVFNLFQEKRLNRRLVHCLLEGFMRQLFSDYGQQLDEIYFKDNCPRHSGRPCPLHESEP